MENGSLLHLLTPIAEECETVQSEYGPEAHSLRDERKARAARAEILRGIESPLVVDLPHNLR
jgi:hypothetical protein